jgi:DNA repair exonuclease SbcCD ATPase subunit
MGETNKTKKSNLAYIILLVIMAIAIAAISWFYYQQKIETEKIVSVLKIEKQDIQTELDILLSEYDTLKTNNDTLNVKLAEERSKIQLMIEDVKQIKATNASKIRQYKKELGTLRNIMKSYITQIDSLNTKNQELTLENIEVREKIQKAKNRNQKLSKTNEDLSNIVEKAAVLKANNFDIISLNKRGRETKKASRLKKIKVCFDISENVVVEPGAKDVFIRIVRPDDLVLTKSVENLFEFEGMEIVYSAKRLLEYENKEAQICIFWENDEIYLPGNYSVDVFLEGNLVGSADFEMK